MQCDKGWERGLPDAVRTLRKETHNADQKSQGVLTSGSYLLSELEGDWQFGSQNRGQVQSGAQSRKREHGAQKRGIYSKYIILRTGKSSE